MTLLLALLSSPGSWAAEVTELAPHLRGDVTFGYGFDSQTTSLWEGTTAVGDRKITEHMVTYGGSFTFAPGAAAYFEIPHYASTRIDYGTAYTMEFDPNTQVGTMLNEVETEAPEVKGMGVGGAWLGLQGSPFSEAFKGRVDRSTWLLGFGFRLKDDSNFWTFTDGTTRGGGPGSPAMRLDMAFSTLKGPLEPYVKATLLRQGQVEADLTDADGTLLASGVLLDPANEAKLLAGVEFITYSDTSKGAKFVADLHLVSGYTSWQDIPSGVYLPSVLDASRSEVVTMGEHIYARVGAGVTWRVIEYVQINLGGEFGSISPYRIENPYSITTGIDTIDWQVTSALKFRARNPPS